MVPRAGAVALEASLPSRERGLKFVLGLYPVSRERSLPSRERGLKYDALTDTRKDITVAPFAGAWIEI